MSTINGIPNDHRYHGSAASGSFDLPRSRRSLIRNPISVVGNKPEVGLISFAMFFVAATGFALTCYLAWAGLTSSKVAGCGGGQIFDCNHVMQTKWSSVFGVPVGVPAVAIYLTLLTSLSFATFAQGNSVRKIARTMLGVCSLAAAFAAIWFISLQLFVVEHLCGYCLAAHSCGLILAALVITSQNFSRSKIALMSVTGLAAISVLATSQILADAPPTYQIETHATTTPIDADSTQGDTGASLFAAPGFESDGETPDQVEDSTIFYAPGTEPEDQTDDGASKEVSDQRILSSNFKMAFLGMVSGNAAMVTVPQESTASKQQSGRQSTAQNKSKDKSAKRLVSINGGNVKLDVAHWPLLGNKDAECVFVEMFDYTCPHCRENHKFLKSAMDQLGTNKVAIMAISVPMNSNCNSSVPHTDAKHVDACELAKIALAVWRVDPSKFGEFHEWLFTGNTPGTGTAMAKAESLVDEQKLSAELQGKLVGQYVAKQVQIYQMIGAGTVPKLLFPNKTLSGKVGSAETLIQIINQQ